jgi:hypothetical protein
MILRDRLIFMGRSRSRHFLGLMVPLYCELRKRERVPVANVAATSLGISTVRTRRGPSSSQSLKRPRNLSYMASRATPERPWGRSSRLGWTRSLLEPRPRLSLVYVQGDAQTDEELPGQREPGVWQAIAARRTTAPLFAGYWIAAGATIKLSGPRRSPRRALR